MTDNRPSTQMPKWLIYGIAAKIALVVLVTGAVLWYAGVFGSFP